MNDVDTFNVIIKHVFANGPNNWSMIAPILNKSIKQIRETYKTYINTPVDHEWEQEEFDLLTSAVDEFGKRWKRIACLIPGRSEDELRTEYAKIQKRNNSMSNIKPIRQHQIRDYDNYPDVFEKMKDGLQWGELSELSEISKIPISTLHDWTKFVIDGNRPEKQDRMHRYTAFNIEEELEILEIYDENKKYGLFKSDLGRIAKKYELSHLHQRVYRYYRSLPEYSEYTDEEIDDIVENTEDHILEAVLPRFTGSSSWINGFCDAYRINLKSPHADRRGPIDQAYVQHYKTSVINAISIYGKDKVINMDETSTPKFLIPRKILGDIGLDTDFEIPCSKKDSFTSICSVTASGQKLLPWFVARGTTKRTEEKFLEMDNIDECIITHSANGWVDEAVMLEYINYLSGLFQNQPICLILDVFASHRSTEVKNRARELNIELIFVPANGTGLYQPLDVGVFGDVKQRLLSYVHQSYLLNHDEKITCAMAGDNFINVWRLVRESSISNIFDQIFDLDDYQIEFSE